MAGRAEGTFMARRTSHHGSDRSNSTDRQLRPGLRILSTPQNTLGSGTTSEIEDANMTDRIAEHRIRLTGAEARTLGEAAMRGAGFDDDDAGILTDPSRKEGLIMAPESEPCFGGRFKCPRARIITGLACRS
jgi:hypothetical protein